MYALLFIALDYTAPLYQQTQPSYVPQSVALSGPTVIKDWEEGNPIPAGFHPEKRRRNGLFGGGIGLLAGFYLPSMIIGGVNIDARKYEGSPSFAMFIPVLGPFIEMGYTGSAAVATLLLIDGLAQLGGAVMAIVGWTVPKIVLVRNDVGGVSLDPTTGKVSF